MIGNNRETEDTAPESVPAGTKSVFDFGGMTMIGFIGMLISLLISGMLSVLTKKDVHGSAAFWYYVLLLFIGLFGITGKITLFIGKIRSKKAVLIKEKSSFALFMSAENNMLFAGLLFLSIAGFFFTVSEEGFVAAHGSYSVDAYIFRIFLVPGIIFAVPGLGLVVNSVMKRLKYVKSVAENRRNRFYGGQNG